MSAEKSGFIQAYSRRQRAAKALPFDSRNSEPELRTEAEEVSEDFTNGEDANDSSSSQGSMVLGGLELDDAISDTASLWFENADGSMLRIDQVDSDPLSSDDVNSKTPQALVEERSLSDGQSGPRSADELLASLQHTFTSYAEPAGKKSLTHGSQDEGLTGSEQVESDQTLNHASADSFSAAWEVDAFEIPETVNILFRETGLMSSLSERLSEAVRTRLRSIMVTSLERGEGKTSVAIGLAMAGAASGINVALVDADLANPSLVDSLNLDVLHGWDDHSSGVPMSEIAIRSVRDRLTLFPLINHGSREAVNARVRKDLITLLSDHFDLVIFDGGASCQLREEGQLFNADSAVIVQDVSRSTDVQVSTYTREILQAGIKSVGVVANHAP